jgi:hypothetical protein
VKQVAAGAECGVHYRSRTRVDIGDVLETYTVEMRGRELKIEGLEMR